MTDFADLNDLMRKTLDLFPDATIEEDTDGQIVVSTGLRCLTSDQSPTIPEGEVAIIRFETEM